MNTEATLKTTPLLEYHRSKNARLAEFAGWLMPIQYEGIITETLHTRNKVSIFDICHMGEFLLKGNLKKSNLDFLMTSKLDDLTVGSCRYSSMLNKKGGIIDDLLIYRKAHEEWMIVVNAGNIDKDRQWIKENLSKNSEFKDVSNTTGKIDLQGPFSREVLKNIAPEITNLKYYTFTQTDILGEKNIISRTGYTGELGFEIYISNDKIEELWNKILKNDAVRPAGLGARDVLRLEMGYSLYGEDIDENITPLDAGLENFIDFNKDFIGKEALIKQKKSQKILRRVFINTLSRRSPRHNYSIFIKDKNAGRITSGTFSPHLQKGIGMGLIHKEALNGSNTVFLGDDSIKIEALITEKPFVKKTSLRN